MKKEHMPEQLELFPGDSRFTDVLPESRPSNPTASNPVETGVKCGASGVSGKRRSEAKTREQKWLAEALRVEIEKATNLKISLVVTNNTSNMMSINVDPADPTVRVRVHHMFLDAPLDVRRALTYLVEHPRSRKYAQCLRKFIASRSHQIRPTRATRTKVQTRGAVYDLRSIFEELNDTYFQGAVDAAITWGRNTTGARRSIRFGCYYESTKLIRIHQRLDQDFVPFFVVRYIVYHEMLHAHLGLRKNQNGRRQIHSREFKKIEAAYPEYQAAVAWIENQDNLNRLLRPGKARKRR